MNRKEAIEMLASSDRCPEDFIKKPTLCPSYAFAGEARDCAKCWDVYMRDGEKGTKPAKDTTGYCHTTEATEPPEWVYTVGRSPEPNPEVSYGFDRKVSRLQTELEKATADNDALAEEVIELKAEFRQYDIIQIQQERIEMGEARAAADERTAVVATQLLDSGICPKEADNSTCNRPCIDCWLSYLRGDG